MQCIGYLEELYPTLRLMRSAHLRHFSKKSIQSKHLLGERPTKKVHVRPSYAIKIPRALPNLKVGYVNSVSIHLLCRGERGQRLKIFEPSWSQIMSTFIYKRQLECPPPLVSCLFILQRSVHSSPLHLSLNVLLLTARSNPCRGRWPQRKLFRCMSCTRRLSRSRSRGGGISKA